jgi:hypothetical protein
MRIPAYTYRSRQGIYFFRIVVPQSLRETFDGRTEVRLSLHTRKLREAMQLARPLASQLLDLFDRAGAGMKRNEPTVADLLEKATKGELLDLRAHKSITLPDGRTLQYDLETHSTDPAELAAFERQVEAERKEMREAEARYYEKQMDIPPAMKVYQEQQAREMAAYRAELDTRIESEKTQAASGTTHTGAAVQGDKNASSKTDQQEESPKFTFDPANIFSLRWAEYMALTSSTNWTGPRTEPGNVKKVDEFRQWWGKDDDIRAIDRKLINVFILFLKTERVVEKGQRRGTKGLGTRYIVSSSWTAYLPCRLTIWETTTSP